MDDIIGTHMFGATLDRGSSKGQVSVSQETKTQLPHGIAKFDLSGFLRGGCKLQMTIPVRPSPRLNLQRGSSHSLLVPPGNYIDTNCEMTVTFEIWRPLDVLIPGCFSWKTDSSSQTRQTSKVPSSKSFHKKGSSKSSFQRPSSKSSLEKHHEGSTSTHCPFNRIVYVVSSQRGTGALDQVLYKVNEINAATLELDNLPGKVQRAALSTYKLTR